MRYSRKISNRSRKSVRRAILAAAAGAAVLTANPALAWGSQVLYVEALPAAGSWSQDASGYYRYYGADGNMWVNTVTPDGFYVDGTGAWVPDMYDVSAFTSIPEDAGCLMVIEGHGTAARASFYVKETAAVSAGPGSADAAGSAGAAGSTGAAAGEDAAGSVWRKVTDTGAYVGRNGIGKETEGDEKTPRGLFTLDEAFGTSPDLGNFAVPYLQVDDGYYWVGDSASPYYNQMVDIRQTGAVFDTAASEHLSTYGGKAYHYCMAVGYNKEQTPYKGSAIFLHCTDGPGTGGCIAIPEEAMVTVLQNIRGQAYILIDDGANLANY